jgi:hypothetical protein
MVKETMDRARETNWMECTRNPRYLKAIELAMMVGIFFLLRKSEYLVGGKQGMKGIKFKDLSFFTVEGTVIPFELVGWSKAQSVHLVIPFSKTDQQGYGRLLQHARVTQGVCVVTELEAWLASSRDVFGYTRIVRLYDTWL